MLKIPPIRHSFDTPSRPTTQKDETLHCLDRRLTPSHQPKKVTEVSPLSVMVWQLLEIEGRDRDHPLGWVGRRRGSRGLIKKSSALGFSGQSVGLPRWLWGRQSRGFFFLAKYRCCLLLFCLLLVYLCCRLYLSLSLSMTEAPAISLAC